MYRAERSDKDGTVVLSEHGTLADAIAAAQAAGATGNATEVLEGVEWAFYNDPDDIKFHVWNN